MEGFLEANRIVEVSLTKLNSIHKTGDLPLRKTLLISKVLNTAQEVATSAHLSFIKSPPTNSTRSSKLLASISQDSDESRLPTSLARPVKLQSRQTSPIASATLMRQEPLQVTEEPMDFVNVSSVLSDILGESETSSPPVTKEPLKSSLLISSDMKKNTKRSKLLDNVSKSNTTSLWSAWQFDLNSEMKNQWQLSTPISDNETSNCPKSPGKRNHQDAFPLYDKENCFSWNQLVADEPKRFKPSTPEGCPLESLPGFCGYLSPKNLQSAPLITYMFGSGFAQPSNPDLSSSDGWPTLASDYQQEISDHDHFATFAQTPTSRPHPILAY